MQGPFAAGAELFFTTIYIPIRYSKFNNNFHVLLLGLQGLFPENRAPGVYPTIVMDPKERVMKKSVQIELNLTKLGVLNRRFCLVYISHNEG